MEDKTKMGLLSLAIPLALAGGFVGGAHTVRYEGVKPHVYAVNVYGDETPEIVIDNGARKIVYVEEDGQYKPLIDFLEGSRDSEISQLERNVEAEIGKIQKKLAEGGQ